MEGFVQSIDCAKTVLPKVRKENAIVKNDSRSRLVFITKKVCRS